MKALMLKISSIFMALLVLFSSFSFSVYEHICGGEVASVSYFIEAESCGMEMKICENETPSQQKVKQEPCCSDHIEVIQGNDYYQQIQTSLQITQVQFLAAFVTSYSSLFDKVKRVPLNTNYSPPLVVKNIQKLDETYLI